MLSLPKNPNISQALQDENWVEAMQEELLQFKLQKVWILVDLPSGKKEGGNQRRSPRAWYETLLSFLMEMFLERPDIMFAVCACARFQVTPKASHLNAVKGFLVLVVNNTTNGHQFTMSNRLQELASPKQMIWVVTPLFENMLVQAQDEEQQQSPSRITSSPSLSPQPTPPSPSPEPIQPTYEAEETTSMPHDSPLHVVHSHGSAEGSVQQHDLMVLVTKLNDRIDGLEKDLLQTKKTYSTALTKLVLRVKKLESKLKSGKAMRKAKIEEEVHEKPSDETEVLVQEETPTEIIEEHGSGEKCEMEISTANIQVSTASPPKVSTAVPHVYTRRSAKDKEKAIIEEPATPKKVKKRTQVQLSMDEELPRKLEEKKKISLMQTKQELCKKKKKKY
ncbi:hypothetical protein Tco_0255379 [Tanacetum coccineum]